MIPTKHSSIEQLLRGDLNTTGIDESYFDDLKISVSKKVIFSKKVILHDKNNTENF